MSTELKFQVGDRVKVVAFTAPGYGCFATIHHFYDSHEFPVRAVLDGYAARDLRGYRESELELVPEVADDEH